MFGSEFCYISWNALLFLHMPLSQSVTSLTGCTRMIMQLSSLVKASLRNWQSGSSVTKKSPNALIFGALVRVVDPGQHETILHALLLEMDGTLQRCYIVVVIMPLLCFHCTRLDFYAPLDRGCLSTFVFCLMFSVM